MVRLSLILTACWLFAGAISTARAEQITYERHIRPILKANCFHCHGEDKELAGGLDLRLRRMIVEGGDSGEAIRAGDAESSLLVTYVESGTMPPGDERELSESEVEQIARWIDQGAPTELAEPSVRPEPGEFLVTAQERNHWAYQPIEKPPVPQVADRRMENPIDAFVARKLHQAGLEFSPPADRATLIRRATLDLTGLPPTPQQVRAFVDDDSPRAYENLIDRLLSSPAYGERWSRHWLDVAGYADSEGYNNADTPRPDAWAYRDYVTRSFNSDKPWDEFITEQLAGDELVGATHGNAQQLANTDEAAREKLTATGFLRMAPDGTGSRPADPQQARHSVLTETVKIVSSSLLGMTVGCAECHDHRFDPIPQEDFYRLRAIFEPVFDVANWRKPAARRTRLLSPADQARAEEIEQQASELDAKAERIKQEVLETVLQRVLAEIPEDRRDYAAQAFETAAADRTDEQKMFVQEKYPMLGLLRPGRLHLFLNRFEDGQQLKASYEDVEAEASKLRATKPKPNLLRVATEDPEHVPTTHVFYRGDPGSPEEESIPPGGLSVLAATAPADASNVAKRGDSSPSAGSTVQLASHTFPANQADLPSTGRRLAYARYLTSGRHPLAPRVLVNRFWMHHFGRGLVETIGDFGARSTPPSHPELLDWLAADFVQHGWELKRLHRLIMTSHAYRQSSQTRSGAVAVDADNRLLWRMPVRRLEAEAIRDSLLAVSGQLNRQMGGRPVPVETGAGGATAVGGREPSASRRSLYVQVRRTDPVAMFEAFDAPRMQPNCERRVTSTVATQSLSMLNGKLALAQAEACADRILAELGDASPVQQAQRAWRRVLGESPSTEQQQRLAEFLTRQTETFQNNQTKQPQRQALASLCQALMASSQFLYVD